MSTRAFILSKLCYFVLYFQRLGSCIGVFCFFGVVHLSDSVFSQTDSLPNNDLLRLRIEDMYERSKEDLLNKQITIASKKSESLFDAPFAASVITHDEIKRAGSTSIMEAFRLIPGLVVTEQSNGNYDIHLRGGSNVQRNAIFSVGGNTTTLVMIDNRPIYNYYLGGTFWETIPIDLNDVDRIELVRGPTSAMYGPNAVAGVINIITRKPQKQGAYAIVNAQQGTDNSYLNNASLGYKFNKKLSVALTGNWQQRNRGQDTYYNYQADAYVPADTILRFDPNGYPAPEQALRRYGANLYLSYRPASKYQFNLTAGLQDSRVQKVYTENFVTPFSTSTSESNYIDFTAKLNRLTTQVSYQRGTQSEGLGAAGQKWDFNTFDALLEYDFNFRNLNIKPGINYRSAIYDDTPFVDVELKTGQFNARREIDNVAPYLRGDYLLLRNTLRLIAAVRLDLFNFPDGAYFSYQFAANYKLKNKHLFRAVFSRAKRSANIIFTYADTFINPFPLFLPDSVAVDVSGNRELDLLTKDTWELGYRGKIRDNLQVDVELYHSETKNYADFLYGTTETRPGIDAPVQNFQTFNIPLKTRQTGLTFSLNYIINRFQIRPFFTYQHTTLVNSSTFNNTQDAQFVPANPNPAADNIDSGIGTETDHTGTPNWYGGAYLNYQISSSFNLNINPYFFTETEYFAFQNTFFPDGRGVGQIPAKFILNAKLSYTPTSYLDLYLSGRNLLNQDSVEFYNTDRIGISLFGGIHFEF